MASARWLLPFFSFFERLRVEEDDDEDDEDDDEDEEEEDEEDDDAEDELELAASLSVLDLPFFAALLAFLFSLVVRLPLVDDELDDDDDFALFFPFLLL